MRDDAWDQGGFPTEDVVPTGAVAVTRARDFYGVFCGIKLFDDEDEHEVGYVHYGHRRVFHLPAGVRSLSVGQDSRCSPLYEIEVKPGEVIELEAAIRWRGFFSILMLFTWILMPARAFVLRPLPDPAARPHLGEVLEGALVLAGLVVFLGAFILLQMLFASLVF